jgi:hypothetical protein
MLKHVVCFAEAWDSESLLGLFVFLGLLLIVVVLTAWLVRRLRAPRATRESLRNWDDTAREISEDVRKGRDSFAPVVFFFYIWPGVFWLMALENRGALTREDWTTMCAMSMPHLLIFAIGVQQCVRRRSFLGLSLAGFVLSAVVASVLPLALLFVPKSMF